ncbi:acyl-CoA synthetase [Microbacterium sp. NPDC087665]|uniref:acyl-CoA synthetase n=1 Tax=Microbacterium sp. NPDC087665 TaxID=3364194 RepID=UPI00381E7C93
MSAPARAFTVRHVQLLRALFAAAAAVMITFSSDHSAAVGLSVFSGFAFVTGFVLILAVFLVLPAGSRWPYVILGLLGFAAGMATGIPMWRTNDLFFIVVSSWALITGAVELLAGVRARRAGDPTGRDGVIIGAFGVLLGILLLLIPAGFTHDYTIDEAGTFELSGIILGVGMFGGYAALVAVFLGIAGLTPKKADAVASASVPAESGDAR